MIKYKESGVGWIGQIPEDWEVDIIGNYFKNRKVKVSDKDFVPLSVAKIGVVPQMENIAKSDASDDRKLVCKGDFVINSRSDRKMSCGYSSYEGSVSLINTVLTPFDNIVPEYSNYLLKNYGFAEEFYRWGHGIVADLWTTNWEDMKKISIPLPSKELQRKIVEILDKKCEQIDELIKLQENEIEKLKEYKQSVITEVVTKGLDKNAKMKDSGIDWIGQIPEYWSLVRFKDFFYNKKEIVGENSVSFDRLALTLDGVIKRNKDDSDGLQPKEFDGYQILRDNDFVFKMIDLQNISTSRVGLSPFTGIVSPAYIRFVNKKKCNNKYFYYFLMSLYYNEVYNNLGGNGVRSSLSASDMGNFICPYPNKIEQENIVRILDNKIIQIDNLIKQKNNKIEKLQDYKKSLIYEYVTGKKEV